MSEDGWKDFDYKNSDAINNLKGKYLCKTINGNTWVVDLNKDKSGYPHKCSCGMNAAMSMHFTKYRSLPQTTEFATKADYEVVIESHKELVRKIDVILNGKNAARQASLCDLVGQIKEVKQREAELLATIGELREALEEFVDDVNPHPYNDFRKYDINYHYITAKQVLDKTKEFDK